MHALRQTLLLLLSAAALAGAEVYKWVDEDGVVHYSEHPPPSGDATAVPLAEPAQPATPARVGDADALSVAPAGDPGAESQPVDRPAPTTVPAFIQFTPAQARCYEAWIALRDLDQRGDVYLDEAGRLYRAGSLHDYWYESGRRWPNQGERRELQREYERQVAEYCDESRRDLRRHAEDWERQRNRSECRMARAKYDSLGGREGKTPRGELERIERLLREHCG